MIYVSLGLTVMLFGVIFLVYGIRRRWREMMSGAVVITLVGLFLLIGSLIAVSRL